MTETLWSACDAIESWLRDKALPLWAGRGCDRGWGGFYEQIDTHGNVVEVPRRSRLVARQIYVFAQANRIGWRGDGHALVDHGLDFLIRNHLRADGLARLSVQPDRIDDGFDLYDQAFTLFAFAEVARVGLRCSEMARRAAHLLQGLQRYRHPSGGFQEALPATIPLRSNPHMHMLEAALAWVEIGGLPAATNLADEIGTLCLNRFIAEETGAVHEFFDAVWRPLAVPGFGPVEPGHQYEWGWLLLRWRGMVSADVAAAAERMIELAERHGRSFEGLAINSLAADLTPCDLRYRLWPQTERMKAQLALARRAGITEDRDRAESVAAEAAHGLFRFFGHPIEGAWWEHLTKDGASISQPSRASSLYHIVGAYMELKNYLSGLARETN